MSNSPTIKKIWWERSVIVGVISIYLIIFNRTVAHGDALRIVRQIDSGHLEWNPNHLIFDPIGYAWYFFLQKLGISISALNSFEVISGITTILSLLIFHKLLLKIGVNKLLYRVIAIGGLFASQSFLSMAVSQYYFMIQMPFLLGVFYYGILLFTKTLDKDRRRNWLYLMGAFSAIATAIMFNNLLLVFTIGLLLIYFDWRQKTYNFSSLTRFWGAAAIIGFPVFIIGYFLSASNVNFLSWLVSYAGDSGSELDKYYGFQWNIKWIAESIIRLCSNLFFANIIELAGLGTYLKVFIFGETLEFIPNITKFSLAIILMPVVGGLTFLLCFWMVRWIKADKILQFNFAFIIAYLIFNFLWGFGGDMFWFQILPSIWLLFLMKIGATNILSTDIKDKRPFINSILLKLVVVTVPLLLILNTLQTVVPVSLVDLEQKGLEHKELLRNNDLEIIVGWDGLRWMSIADDGSSVEQLVLMNMALNSKESDFYIGKLPQIINNQLLKGGRVIIARVYDLDYTINPWYGLTNRGWSRAKIQSLLKQYCNREIAKIDDVVFREIYSCEK